MTLGRRTVRTDCTDVRTRELLVSKVSYFVRIAPSCRTSDLESRVSQCCDDETDNLSQPVSSSSLS